jgi:F1F0 ATPase subunit 2
MSSTLSLLLFWLLGLALGGFFFVGLWWTVQKSIRSAHPASWLLTSMLVRMGVIITGFYLIVTFDTADAAWLRLLICLLGFISARLIVSKLVSKPILERNLKNDTPVNLATNSEYIHLVDDSSQSLNGTSQHAP